MDLGKIISIINWVDILIIIILIRTSYVGFCKGASKGIVPLLVAFAALIASLHYYETIGTYISSRFPIRQEYSEFFSFVAVGTLLLLIVHIILSKAGGGADSVNVTTLFDNMAGLTLGIVRGMLLASFIVMALGMAPYRYIQESVREKSLISGRLESAAHAVYKKALYVFSPNND